MKQPIKVTLGDELTINPDGTFSKERLFGFPIRDKEGRVVESIFHFLEERYAADAETAVAISKAFDLHHPGEYPSPYDSPSDDILEGYNRAAEMIKTYLQEPEWVRHQFYNHLLHEEFRLALNCSIDRLNATGRD